MLHNTKFMSFAESDIFCQASRTDLGNTWEE